jgi:hypothetical protein
MKLLKKISKWLVVLGAIEVGLMGVLSFDLVGALLGSWPVVVVLLYGLIGLSGFWGAFAMLMGKKKR